MEELRIRLKEQIEQERAELHAKMQDEPDHEEKSQREKKLASLEHLLEGGLDAMEHFDLHKVVDWLEGDGLEDPPGKSD